MSYKDLKVDKSLPLKLHVGVDEYHAQNSEGYTVLTSQKRKNIEEAIKAINNHAALVHELEEILSWAAEEKSPLREQEIASIRAVLEKARLTNNKLKADKK